MRSYYAIKRSYVNRDASLLDLQNKINNTVSQVRTAYLDVLKYQNLVKSKEIALDRSEEQLRKQRLAFEIGSATRLDTLKAHVSYNTDKVDLINSRNSLKQAVYTLNTILGIDPFTQLTVENIDESKLPKLEDFRELKEMVLSRNPSLKATEVRLKASTLTRKQYLSPFIPTLSFSYRYSRSHDQAKKVFLEDFDLNWQANYGWSVSWNLFNGFADKVNYQKSKIDEINSIIKNSQTKDNLLKSLAVAYDNLKSAIQVVNINKTNLESAKEDYRLASEKKLVGSATILEVRDAQVNLSRAEQSLIEAYFNALKARAQIDELVGTEYHIDDKDGTL
jgi:outer membrane protein TolC